jgi:3-phenylpropionate/cinnamic acid dioxygenase small subunit
MGTEVAGASDLQVWFEVQSFLVHEAELLDEGRLREWLELLAADIRYQIPIRLTRERSAVTAVGDLGFHMNEDKGMLQTRILRLETEYAWAEDPPSRTRRYVSNVRVHSASDSSLNVRSNLLLYRGRHAEDQLVAGTREDVLRRRSDGFEIAARVVYLDQTTLSTHNLAVFL